MAVPCKDCAGPQRAADDFVVFGLLPVTAKMLVCRGFQLNRRALEKSCLRFWGKKQPWDAGAAPLQPARIRTDHAGAARMKA